MLLLQLFIVFPMVNDPLQSFISDSLVKDQFNVEI